MPFDQIAKFGLISFFILGFYFYRSHKYYSLLGLLILSFGLNSFTALAGTLWFPYKVVMFATTLYAFNKFVGYEVNNLIKPYYILIAISVLVAWVTSPSIPGTTFLQGPMMRPIVQSYTYVTMALMVPFIVSLINTIEKVQWSLKIYYRLSEIIIFIGFIHFIFIILNLPFIPILRPGGEANEYASFGMHNAVIKRIYGLSGEPKTLATFVLPYIFISYYNFLEGNYNKNRVFHLITLIISIVVLLYSFSSALLISAGISMVLIPVLFKHRFSSQIFRYAIILGLTFLIFSNTGKSYTNTNSKKELSMMDILYERSFGRVEKESEERFETIALEHIFNKTPHFLLTGFGLGMYNYHLPLSKHSRGVEPIDSGWVVILLDLGILGLLFFWSVFRKVNQLKNFNKVHNNIILNSYLIGTTIGFLAHIGNNALYQIFLFLGLSMAAYNVLINQESRDRLGQ